MSPGARLENWGGVNNADPGRVDKIPIPSDSPGDEEPERRSKGWLANIVLRGIVTALLLAYCTCGIVYLTKDYMAVHRCHSSSNVHIIWETSLWIYVLLSLIFSGITVVVLFSLPFARVVDAFHYQMESRRVKQKPLSSSWEDEFERMQRRRTRFGVMDELPDWIFLLIGTAMMGLAVATFILAMFGYSELYLAHPWCEDKSAAFEELDLWRFGHVTFILQLCLGVFFSVMGVCFWALPLIFELIDPEIEPLMLDMDAERANPVPHAHRSSPPLGGF